MKIKTQYTSGYYLLCKYANSFMLSAPRLAARAFFIFPEISGQAIFIFILIKKKITLPAGRQETRYTGGYYSWLRYAKQLMFGAQRLAARAFFIFPEISGQAIFIFILIKKKITLPAGRQEIQYTSGYYLLRKYANSFMLSAPRLAARAFFILIFIFILINNTDAQNNTINIDLKTVLEMGGANNLTIKKYELQKELALAELTEANSWWLPEIYAGVTAHQRWGAAMNTDGRIFTGLNRQNLWAGLGASGHWKLGEGMYGAKVADIRSKAIQFQQEAAKNEVLLEIIGTYYDFLAAQLKTGTYSLLIAQADTIAQQLKIQSDAGLGYQSDWLMARSNIKHLQVEQLNAKKEIAEKTARLIGLLNLPPNTRLVSTETVVSPLKLVSENEALTDLSNAYAQRPEMKYMDFQRQALETEKEGLRKGMALPELSLGVYGASFGDIFSPQRPTAEINAGVLWRIPLELALSKHQGPYKKIDAQLKIQQFEAEEFKNQINEELAAAKWTMEAVSEQMSIAKEGSELAGQAYQQSVQRQQLGTARPFEILQAQEMFMQAQLDYLQAVTAYNRAQYRMYVALGNGL